MKKQIDLEAENKEKWKRLVLIKEEELNDFTEKQLQDMSELEGKMK